jgi:glycogen debranching enzyme
LLTATALLVACSSPARIGLISTEDGLREMLEGRGYICEDITPESDLGRYDLVWWNRTDTTAITPLELAAGPAFVRYLEKGGRVVLSMDAVRLGNAWGLEPNPVEENTWAAEDYGFGRKVGFHSYLSHPLFDGMHGGAYVWHGHQDNNCRVLGYTGNNAPGREGTRIAATLWELIFYHPDYKVIWEQQVGKGRLLSIGCFLYYDSPNFNSKILDRFTANVVNWLTGGKTESKERYWTYAPALVETGVQTQLPGISASSSIWKQVTDVDSLSFAPAAQEITVPSRRCMTVCDERGGIKEIWTHPIMSLKEMHVSVASEGNLYLLKDPASVTLRAGSISRYYDAGPVRVTEILTTDPESPAVVAHYQWEGAVDSLVVSFSSNMRLMWPYDSDALGSIRGGWSQKAGLYAITAGDGEYVSLIGTNLPGKVISEGRAEQLLQLNASLSLDASGRQACDVVMAAGSEGLKPALWAYKKAMDNPRAVYENNTIYWQKYLESTVSVVSPDPVFNEGYRWATVSAGQFLAETPGIGTALMAGYASSLRGWGGGHRVSGRPGYAWYFGRDSELAGFAYLGMGDFQAVKSTLEVLSDFQGEDGPIFHELTTSGSDHFDASDATPLYVILMADYLRATGDTRFVKEHMPNVYKAMDFCFSTDTDGDHFIEIRHVGHGWLEGGDYFADNTEFYLCGIWARALADASWLAGIYGEPDKSKAWAEESKVVTAALDRFWNPKGYYNYGIYNDGTFTTSLLALESFPIWLGVTDQEKAASTVQWYSGSNFTQPWGVRQSGDPRDEENVGPYDESNIWPLLTGSVSLAEYCTGFKEPAFYHLMGNLKCYSGSTHGRVPEVLRGNAYRSGGITAFQCWSETGVTGPVIRGMLGWTCNAIDGTCTLEPQLPEDWGSLKVRGLRIGKDYIGFDMTTEGDTITFDFTSTGAPKELTFTYAGNTQKLTLYKNTKLVVNK